MFRFHKKWKQRIINLCFADDLFLFARGDVHSANVIMQSQKEFTLMSGLVPSIPKSTVFFCNVTDNVKQQIINTLQFGEGELPVRYLGVPLISSRLGHSDCSLIIERLDAKINDWKSKMLSFAGRLQLIKSVLSAMHVYWASVFNLPVRVAKNIEKRMKQFLWSKGPLNGLKAKVAWKDVCLHTSEGDLGIRRFSEMNKALMSFHIWSIITKRSSVSVEWIYVYKLQNRH